ncbi:MAG: cytochrome c biogenesis protein CcdA [Pyrinomonadaceae bacterium]
MKENSAFKFGCAAFSMLLIFVLAGSLRAQNPVALSMTVRPAKAKAGDKLTAQISASIGGGWHMYSITQGAGGPVPTRITVDESGVFKAAGNARGSAPQREMDANFGIITETYSGSATFTVPVAVDAAAQAGAQTLSIGVRYQVCNDSVCLPPKTVKVSAPVEIIAGTAAAQTSPTPTPSVSPSATPTPKPTPTTNANISANLNQNSPANIASVNANANAEANTNTENLVAATENPNPPTDLASGSTATNSASSLNTNSNSGGGFDKNQSIWSFIWLAMSVGALSLLTPCVFPMIPITVSYFTNHSTGASRASAVRNATIYALGIILTFTALGVALAVVFGAAGINQFASNPWVNLIITGIFAAFALSLFGAYNLQIPPPLMSRLDAYARGKESSHIVGLLLMGFVFSLTSFTCTAPFVGTLLVLAAQGQWLYPLVGMLAFSTVFALPFFVLALAPQLISQLPKSGGWLNSVKVVMGLMEIAAAMKFLSNVDLIWRWGIFTREVVLASWIAIALLIGLYLLGKFQLLHDSPTQSIGAARLMFAFISLALGFYLLTGLFGKPLGELESFLPPMSETTISSNQKSDELNWITNDYEAALKKAKAENKSIFIDFTGYTCTNCRWMEANMFPRKEVTGELEKYVLVRLYTDGEGEPFEGFQKMQQDKFGTVALPFYVVTDANGNPQKTFSGLTRNAAEFAAFLKQNQ